MRLVCPNCSSPYEVPDRLLQGSTRKLRCARCGTVWDAAAQMRAAEAFPPEPEVMAPLSRSELTLEELERDLPRPIRRDPIKKQPPPRGSALLVLAWILTIAVVAGVVAAFILYPDEIVEAWPAAEWLYRWAGALSGSG